MPETVRSSIHRFTRSEEFRRGSDSLRKRHKIILAVLEDKAGPSTPVARLDRFHVDDTLNDRRDRGCSESSLNNYRSSLRTFGNWLVDVGLMKASPAVHLKNKRVATDPAKRKPVVDTQVREMIDLARERHPRDAISILLLIFTGLRNVEICHLRWRDIDWEAGTIKAFRSKLNDYHISYMPPMLVEELKRWHAWVEAHHGPVQSNWYVVPALAQRGTQPGRIPWAMSPDWPLAVDRPQTNLLTRVKQLLKAVGETDVRGRGVHTMRRTAANLILQKTGDIRVAQRMLGHASVTQTEAYLDVDAQSEHYRQATTDWSI